MRETPCMEQHLTGEPPPPDRPQTGVCDMAKHAITARVDNKSNNSGLDSGLRQGTRNYCTVKGTSPDSNTSTCTGECVFWTAGSEFTCPSYTSCHYCL